MQFVICLTTLDIINLMKRILPLLVILLVSLAYGLGAASTPFHPDESTQIFMSSDLQRFFQQPSALFWQPEPLDDLRQHYRLLDAPLTRTLIGAGLWITHTAGLPADWDWSKTWDENTSAGALPAARTLTVSRLSVMWLFPFSLWLIFRSAQTLAGTAGGWAALLLTATNAFLLLHTRRAMAESSLLFGVALVSWSVFSHRKQPWVMGVAAALAFNAKQSAAPLALIGLIAVLWPDTGLSRRHKIRDVFIFGACFTGITLLLNPFLWAHPVAAGQAALAARADLTARQVTEIGAQAPGTTSMPPLARLGALLAQLYFAPLAIADVGNYLANTQAASQAYLSNPLNTLLRNLAGGAVLLLLTLLGTIVAMRNLTRHPNRTTALLILAALFQTTFLILFFPIPWQRYYLPALPLFNLLAANIMNGIKKAPAPPSAQRLSNSG